MHEADPDNRMGHQQIVAITFRGDGKRLASLDRFGQVEIWDGLNGERLSKLQSRERPPVLHGGETKRFTTAPLGGLAFSPGGDQLAVGVAYLLGALPLTFQPLRPQGVLLWQLDAPSPRPESCLVERFKGPATGDVDCGPQGQWAAVCAGAVIQVVDLTSGKPLYRLTYGQVDAFTHVAVNRDGTLVAAIGKSKEAGCVLLVWEVRSQRRVFTTTISADKPGRLTFSPDGKRLAAVLDLSTKAEIRAWGIAVQKEIFRTELPHANLTALTFSPDGMQLAAACPPHPRAAAFKLTAVDPKAPAFADLRVWDLTSRRELLARTTTTPQFSPGTFLSEGNIPYLGYPVSVAFSADGKRLLSFTLRRNFEATIQVWEVASGQEMSSFRRTRTVKKGASFSPDGKRLVTLDDNDVLKLWDVETDEELLSLKYRGSQGLRFSADGSSLFAPGEESLALCRVGAQPVPFVLRKQPGHMTAVSFSPDGQYLATGSAVLDAWKSVAGEVRIWDTKSGAEQMTYRGHRDGVSGLAFGPEGKWLTSISDYSVNVWDRESGETRFMQRQEYMTSGESLSRDGRLLAAGFGGLTIWELPSGKVRWHSKDTPGSRVALSPDGSLLCYVSGERMHLLQLDHPKESLRLENEPRRVSNVKLSPDGTRLFAVCDDNLIHVWDVARRNRVMTFRGHQAGVTCIAISQDGRTLASGDAGGHVALWDVGTGRLSRTVRAHTQVVRDLAISPNGTRLATAGEDGCSTLWEIAGVPLVKPVPADK